MTFINAFTPECSFYATLFPAWEHKEAQNKNRKPALQNDTLNETTHTMLGLVAAELRN